MINKCYSYFIIKGQYPLSCATNIFSVDETGDSWNIGDKKKYSNGRYDFAGWTGSNGNTAQTTVTIAHGSTGNKSYTANWTPVTYNISYNLNSGSLPSSHPTSYTIESAAITENGETKVFSPDCTLLFSSSALNRRIASLPCFLTSAGSRVSGSSSSGSISPATISWI